MTEFLEIDGRRIAYDVAGAGPLVVLAHGMLSQRDAYRFLAPQVIAAGYRVAVPDLRGQGESSTGWAEYSRTATAGDLLALVRHLGGPAVIVGHSYSAGSATIAAAQDPQLVRGIALIGPFTRAQSFHLGAYLRDGRYRKGITLLMTAGLLGSTSLMTRYLDHAYPAVKPADWADQISAVQANLREPGRMAVFKKMGMSKPTDAGMQLGNIHSPALVVMGTLDPDFADPAAEARDIVADMPTGLGTVAMVDGAGHYPHTQFPDRIAALLLPFLKEHHAA